MQYITKIDMERTRRGMSIGKLANAAGMSSRTVDNLFNNKESNPTIGTITALCETLDLSLASVFTDDNQAIVSNTKDTIEIEILKAIGSVPLSGKKILLDLIRYMVQ